MVPRRLGSLRPRSWPDYRVCADALVFYYAAVLNIGYENTKLLDLRPYPDATEYFAQAKSLAAGGLPKIQIGFDKLPSQYPMGYPVLMLPWLKALPEPDSVLAPFRANQTIGFLMLILVFAFYSYLKRPLAGGVAALLLATLPAFFTYCRSSLSEISASAFVYGAFAFVYLGLKRERRWAIYTGAVLLGFAFNIRAQMLFFIPLLLAMAIFPVPTSRIRWFAHCSGCLLSFGLAVSPTFALNALQFHDPFKTGYHFWNPALFERHLLFLPKHIPWHLTMLWNYCTLQSTEFNVAHMFGTGTYYVPAYIALLLAGVTFLRWERFTLCALTAALVFFIATMFYAFVDGRFYLPLLVVSVALAVLPVEWAMARVCHVRQKLAAFLILLIFAAACTGYPSNSEYKPLLRGRSQAWDALHFTRAQLSSPRFMGQRWFTKMCARNPGIVFSTINPVYLNALLPKPFIAAAVEPYGWSQIWRYRSEDALALARYGVTHSTPVYALFTSLEEATSVGPRLPRVDGYQWTVTSAARYGVILNLTPVSER